MQATKAQAAAATTTTTTEPIAEANGVSYYPHSRESAPQKFEKAEQPIANEYDEEDDDGEYDEEAYIEEPIGDHLSGGGGPAIPSRDRVRRALNVSLKERKTQHVAFPIVVETSASSLAEGKTTIRVHPGVFEHMLHVRGGEKHGDLTRSQLTEVRLLSEYNELPFDIALDSKHMRGGTAPREHSGNNGESYNHIVRRGAATDYTLRGDGRGLLVFENTDVINAPLFDAWGKVTPADLKKGISRIGDTDESFLDTKLNQPLVDLLHANQDQLMRDFNLSYHDLIAQRQKRHKIILPNVVLDKLIKTAMEHAMEPIQERIMNIRDLELVMACPTTPEGSFAHPAFKESIARRAGQDMADEEMLRVGTLRLTLSVCAVVAGAHAEPDAETGTGDAD